MTPSTTQRFEGRELVPFAQPVSPAFLSEGGEYFSVTYVDDELLIPSLETLIFVGHRLDEDGRDEMCFQDADSYRRGVRLESATPSDGATFFFAAPDNLASVFVFEQALEELMRCSLRRIAKRGVNK
jgi:hypothetical protein